VSKKAVIIAQTLLDAVGLEHHTGMQGKSLWPLLTGKADVNCHRDDVYSEYYNALLKLIRKARNNLEQNEIDGYRMVIRDLFDFISSLDTKLKLYIEKVINQAQIKKGSKLYAHGISLARAAEILGISQWELMFYIGKTRMADVGGGVGVKQRLNYARGLFK